MVLSRTIVDRTGLDGPLPPADPTPRRRQRRNPARTAVIVLTAVIVFLAAVAAGWGLRRYRQFEFVEVPGLEVSSEVLESGSEPEAVNWLLVGTDSREGVDPSADDFLGDADTITGQRADTIMVARVNSSTRSIDLLSVPRDLWVPIVGDTEGRVNGAFNGPGGRERLVLTVENYLGVHINHYAEINFSGFQAMVEALGGVPVWFDTPIRDANSGLNIVDSGCHLLNGPQALSFARARKAELFVNGEWVAEQTGDLGRTARQRQFLSNVAATAATKVNLGGLLTIDRLLGAAAENMVVANGAGVSDVADLARTFASADGGQFNAHTLPVSDWVTPGGAYVLLLDEAAAQPTLEIFRTEGQAPPDNQSLSGDQTIPESKAGVVIGLSAEELTSTAIAGVTQAECPNQGSS